MTATMPSPLHLVHEQRIATAVRAALAGKDVDFRIEDGETVYITWSEVIDGRAHCRVIARGSLQQMREALPVMRAEFQRQLAAIEFGKESGAAIV